MKKFVQLPKKIENPKNVTEYFEPRNECKGHFGL